MKPSAISRSCCKPDPGADVAGVSPGPGADVSGVSPGPGEDVGGWKERKLLPTQHNAIAAVGCVEPASRNKTGPIIKRVGVQE